MKSKVEKVFVLRLWQEDNDNHWKTSLKPVSNTNEAARYFSELTALLPYLQSQISEKKADDNTYSK